MWFSCGEKVYSVNAEKSANFQQLEKSNKYFIKMRKVCDFYVLDLCHCEGVGVGHSRLFGKMQCRNLFLKSSMSFKKYNNVQKLKCYF